MMKRTSFLSVSSRRYILAIFIGDPDEVRALIFKKEDVNFQVKPFH